CSACSRRRKWLGSVIVTAIVVHARPFSRHCSCPRTLHLDCDRGGDLLLAGGVPRGQYAQPGRGDDRRISLPDHRTGAASDPQRAAQSWRHRYFARRPVPDHHLPSLRDRALHPAERLLIAVAGEPWTAVAGGVMIDVRLTPRGGRDAIEGTERRADGRTVLKVR